MPAIALDADAVARGRALFEALGCDGCHVGDRLTNDLTVPLGKRGWLQVPSLEYSSPGPPKGGVEARALADLVAYLRAV